MELAATDKRKQSEIHSIDTRHVDVLDGIRALAILLVLWFHVWQQSWLMPIVRLPFLRALGLPTQIGLDFIPRSGFLFVDMLLLLSAFCLFLPHARAMVFGEPVPEVRRFYWKRIVRIVPPYYLSVLLIFFLVALPGRAYERAGDAFVDLFSTLTFTQVFVPGVYLGTKLNGVLWTAAIEMQFYLLFPLLALCFRKRPLATYLGMVALSMLYLRGYALRDADMLRITLNQLPAFFGVFANGMLAAYGFTLLAAKTPRRWWIAALATVAVMGSLLWIVRMQKAAPSVNPLQLWQAEHRFRLSLAFTLFLLGSALSFRWVRFLLGNRLMRFLSAISYNLYIWHQWLAVKLKEWRIPYWEGAEPPNFTGDIVWEKQYTALVIAASLLVATLLTYLFERPVSRALSGLAPFELPSACPEPPDQPAYEQTFEKENIPDMHHTYRTHGVCSTRIDFDLDESGALHNVSFQNGCSGNLKAIGLLVEGKNAKEVAALLAGNRCGAGVTSCADQLSKAIEQALSAQ